MTVLRTSRSLKTSIYYCLTDRPLGKRLTDMFNSVRTRLTLWYAGVLAVSLIAFALLVYYAAANVFYERQDESLRSTAETVASAYIQELEEEESIAKANEVVLAEMVFPNRYVEVTDP